jgi:hypothetical protein
MMAHHNDVMVGAHHNDVMMMVHHKDVMMVSVHDDCFGLRGERSGGDAHPQQCDCQKSFDHLRPFP